MSAIPQGPTAVVAALREELSALVARTRVAGRVRVGRARVLRGQLAGQEVVLASTGDGARNAELGIRAVLDRFPVARVLVLGVAGALSPALAAGALVVSREVRDREGLAPAPDPDWLEQALARGGAEQGTIVSSERILCTPASKAGAWRSLGARDAAVVDLESAAYARAAAERGIRYLVVRSVCDPADEPLPFDLNRCTDPRGGVNRVKVLRHALRHPGVIGPLWRLYRRVGRCSRRLASFAEELVSTASADTAGAERAHEAGQA
jgi:adenosylhomocysteine nucleosidase